MSDGNDSTDRRITFSEIFQVREFRAVFTASQIAEMGDHMAKAAVTALVLFVTDSVALSAAAFAISYAPWVLGGPFLAALAERLRYRTVMVVSDSLRAVLIGLVALSAVTLLPSTTETAEGGIPPAIWLIIALLFAESMLAPPALAARSAVMPLILEGERVTLGLALNQTGRQATQVLGYMAGALIAIIDPAMALGINACAYVFTAVITRLGLRDREPAMRSEQRSHLLRETREGFQIVFGTPTLRAIAIVVFASMLFAIVPEGHAANWALELAEGDSTRRGIYQGLIMIANPIGHVIAALLIVRLLRQTMRSRLVRYFLVLGPLALVPSITEPGIATVVGMTLVSGLAIAGMLPTLNGIFVQILRHGYRARAFGVMNAGMQIMQGGAVMAVGALVSITDASLAVVVGWWSAAGVVLMLLLATRWPKPQVFTDAIAETTASQRVASQSPAGEPGREPDASPVTAGTAAGRDQPAPGRAETPSVEPGRTTQPVSQVTGEAPAEPAPTGRHRRSGTMEA